MIIIIMECLNYKQICWNIALLWEITFTFWYQKVMVSLVCTLQHNDIWLVYFAMWHGFWLVFSLICTIQCEMNFDWFIPWFICCYVTRTLIGIQLYKGHTGCESEGLLSERPAVCPRWRRAARKRLQVLCERKEQHSKGVPYGEARDIKCR